jgi:hypothetical protein
MESQLSVFYPHVTRTTTRTVRTTMNATKPATEVHGICRWVGGAPSPVQLDSGDAVLLIAPAGKSPTAYHVQRIADTARRTLGYRLTKAGTEDAVYDLEAVDGGNSLRCDCPDATYVDRPGGCKHSKALSVALARLISTSSTPARTETVGAYRRRAWTSS